MDFDVKQIAEFKKVIEDIVDARLKSYGISSFVAAVVTKVNDDGTVNVTIPPDNSSARTVIVKKLKFKYSSNKVKAGKKVKFSKFVNNVLNNSNESLSTGDSVELCTKNGRLSNAWVAIKHGKSVSGGSLEDRVKYLEDNALIFVKTGEYNG